MVGGIDIQEYKYYMAHLRASKVGGLFQGNPDQAVCLGVDLGLMNPGLISAHFSSLICISCILTVESSLCWSDKHLGGLLVDPLTSRAKSYMGRGKPRGNEAGEVSSHQEAESVLALHVRGNVAPSGELHSHRSDLQELLQHDSHRNSSSSFKGVPATSPG